MQQLAQPPRDLPLAATDEGLGGQCLEAPVGDPRRSAELRDLLLVLDCAYRVDEPVRRHQLGATRAQPLPLEVRERVRLELHAPLQAAADIGHHRPVRHLDLHAGDRAGGLGVAEVGVERRSAARLDEERSVRALEAGEVVDVRQVGDEERRVEPRGQRVQPLAHALCTSVPARNSNASR